MSGQHVFISYKSQDDAYARELADALDTIGIPTWAAFKSVRLSHAREIPPAIRNARGVVILMSRLAYASSEVLDEVYYARDVDQLRLPILLPGEVDPRLLDTLPEEIKEDWRLELVRRQYHPWSSAAAVASWIAEAIPAGRPETSSTASATADTGSPAGQVPADARREPFALVSSLGQTYQLEAGRDLRENPIVPGDPIVTGDLGVVVVAPDGSVIATVNDDHQVAVWTLGTATAMRGPALDEALPPGAGTIRLLAIERPIGQAVRITAARGGTAYSLLEQPDGSWAAAELASAPDEFVGGAAVADDLLLLRAGGDTVWAGDHAKRPFGLRSVTGIDSAFGPDGRQYLAGWGTGSDGSPQVEAVAEADGGWERVHRSSGDRAGLVRMLRDAARQSPESAPAALAVQSASGGVDLVPIGV